MNVHVSSNLALPEGVALKALTPHRDSRGTLVEIYRDMWDLGCRPVQVNAVTSGANVLRGVHVHVAHTDHLVVVAGKMILGLHDMRDKSPTAGMSCLVELDAANPRAAMIPVGVAHGFYFPEPSLTVYGVSQYWNEDDEFGCRWECPELKLPFPATNPLLSDRDAAAGDYAELRAAFQAGWARHRPRIEPAGIAR